MTHDEMIAVIQASKNGKIIQQRSICRPDKEWLTCKKKPYFNFEHCDYRKKPEPRERWLNECLDGELGDFMYQSRESAKAGTQDGVNQIKFREVLDDE